MPETQGGAPVKSRNPRRQQQALPYNPTHSFTCADAGSFVSGCQAATSRKRQAAGRRSVLQEGAAAGTEEAAGKCAGQQERETQQQKNIELQARSVEADHMCCWGRVGAGEGGCSWLTNNMQYSHQKCRHCTQQQSLTAAAVGSVWPVACCAACSSWWVVAASQPWISWRLAGSCVCIIYESHFAGR